MIALWYACEDWLGWLTLAVAIVSLATIRTRVATATAALALILVVVELEAARFDGLPHVTEKFDATFLDWARQLSARATAGIAALLSAAPIAAAAARLAKTRARFLAGLAVGAPIGGALLISSARLDAMVLWLLRTTPTDATVDSRLQLLHDAVRDSERILLAGIAIGAVAAALFCTRLLRAPTVA